MYGGKLDRYRELSVKKKTPENETTQPLPFSGRTKKNKNKKNNKNKKKTNKKNKERQTVQLFFIIDEQRTCERRRTHIENSDMD